MTAADNPDLSISVELTAGIVAAYVQNNAVPAAELPALIQSVHASLHSLERNQPVEQEAPAEKQKPAVPIKRSVTPDYIISLEDGKKFKSLKRHLQTSYGMTPDEYRAKWGLPKDYPMVAPNYAAARSSLAKTMGLGRKAQPAPEPEPEPAPVRPSPPKARGGRKPKAVK